MRENFDFDFKNYSLQARSTTLAPIFIYNYLLKYINISVIKKFFSNFVNKKQTKIKSIIYHNFSSINGKPIGIGTSSAPKLEL